MLASQGLVQIHAVHWLTQPASPLQLASEMPLVARRMRVQHGLKMIISCAGHTVGLTLYVRYVSGVYRPSLTSRMMMGLSSTMAGR